MDTSERRLVAQRHRIAYFFLAHRFPKYLRKLIERLTAPNVTFWVHIDTKSDEAEFVKELAGLPVTFIGERHYCRWGYFGFVKANLAGIRQIVRSGQPFDHLVILSGQDYPLMGNEDIRNQLRAKPESSFIHYVPLYKTNPHLADRYEKYHLFLPNNKAVIYPYDSPGVLKRLVNNGLRLSGQFPLPRKVPFNYELYFGSNWIRLSYKAARYIVNFTELNKEMERFFSTTLNSDEVFFQTILVNAPEAERGLLENNNLLFCHWHRSPDLYPSALTMADKDSLLSSQRLFARKFDPVQSAELLDWLDRNTA